MVSNGICLKYRRLKIVDLRLKQQGQMIDLLAPVFKLLFKACKLPNENVFLDYFKNKPCTFYIIHPIFRPLNLNIAAICLPIFNGINFLLQVV